MEQQKTPRDDNKESDIVSRMADRFKGRSLLKALSGWLHESVLGIGSHGDSCQELTCRSGKKTLRIHIVCDSSAVEDCVSQVLRPRFTILSALMSFEIVPKMMTLDNCSWSLLLYDLSQCFRFHSLDWFLIPPPGASLMFLHTESRLNRRSRL
jgi:hypothetical protein